MSLLQETSSSGCEVSQLKFPLMLQKIKSLCQERGSCDSSDEGNGNYDNEESNPGAFQDEQDLADSEEEQEEPMDWDEQEETGDNSNDEEDTDGKKFFMPFN